MTAFDEFAMMVKEAIDETCGDNPALIAGSSRDGSPRPDEAGQKQ